MDKTKHQIDVEDYSRRGVMLVFVLTHVAFVVLWAAGRLNLQHRTPDVLLHQVATSSLWAALSVAAGTAVLVAALRQRREAAALAFSFSVIGSYSTLRLLWALTAEGSNEPLLGGVLGILMALGSYGLCMSYSMQPPPRE